jgi:hypothetical protein
MVTPLAALSSRGDAMGRSARRILASRVCIVTLLVMPSFDGALGADSTRNCRTEAS